jgi:hypothetical protein
MGKDPPNSGGPGTSLAAGTDAGEEGGLGPGQPGAGRGPRRLAWDFLALVGCLVAANADSLFRRDFLPTHDGFAVLVNFHIFYSSFTQDGEFPLWFPYDTCGVPAGYYQLAALTPSNYAVGVVGWLFRVRDVLLLYKWSILGDHLLLLVGFTSWPGGSSGCGPPFLPSASPGW